MLTIQPRERGQVLVLVVLLLVVLLVFVGLALDGGMAFLDRRRMQNASDAGALAGTRELAVAMCDSTDRATADQAIYQSLVDFAESNGVQNPEDVVAMYMRYDGGVAAEFDPPVFVGNSLDGGIGVPNGAAGVSVLSTIQHGTRLVHLAGEETSAASANAVAMTGPLLAGGGLRPFGVPLQLMQTLDPGDSFHVDFKRNGGSISWIAEDEEIEHQHRGWMNFGYVWNVGEDSDFPRAVDDSTNASTLEDWMEDGWNGTIYGGDFIHAKPGTNSSAVCAAPENEIFYIPIYDAIPDCQTEIYDPKPACPTQGGGYCYHIVGFAGLMITECNQGQGEITAELVETIVGEGVPSPNDGYGSDVCDTMNTMVVSLVE
jgi:Flp pilus assembly protein TadG